MAYTETWNAAYEADPADATSDIGDGAGEIRDFKTNIRERLAHDHYMDIAGTDADHGEHALVTLREQSSWGSPGANKGYLGTKEAGGKAELHFKDEDDNLIQITSGGVPATAFNAVPTGEIILFEKDTAVTGYTLQTDVDDSLVYIGSGSGAGGLTGAAERNGGTWSHPGTEDYTLVEDDLPIHSHAPAEGTAFIVYGGSGLGSAGNAYGSDTTTDTFGKEENDGHAHDMPSTYRPPGRVFTRQQRS